MSDTQRRVEGSGPLTYTDSLDGVEADDLRGFFVGWHTAPTPEQHVAILRGSDYVVLARNVNRVVGFVTAITDGVVSAFIPLLEVIPEYQDRGVGTELMRRMLARLDHLYMVDLCCDAGLEPFYKRLSLETLDRGMGRRKPEALKLRERG